MKWSKDPPKKEGWYLYKQQGRFLPIVVKRIVVDDDYLYVKEHQALNDVYFYHGLWSEEPIDMPEEESND